MRSTPKIEEQRRPGPRRCAVPSRGLEVVEGAGGIVSADEVVDDRADDGEAGEDDEHEQGDERVSRRPPTCARRRRR